MILLIDNYDSFTYNLYDYFRQLGEPITIIKNDEWTVEQIIDFAPDMIVLSPGPATPNEAGVTLSLIQAAAGKIPLLGICLGHQAIAQAFGANIIKAPAPVHGKLAMISHDQQNMFAGIKNPLQVVRYHSLIVDPATLPPELIVTARTESGMIMALRHQTWPIESVQFHPEAILSEAGLALLQQFITTYVRAGKTVHKGKTS